MQSQWYGYSEIRYTEDQIVFLLQNSSLLRDGRWPPNPSDSGYTGSPQGKQFRHEGNFVKPAIIIAELELRLTRCGEDGLLLEYLILLDYGDMQYLEAKLAGYLHTTLEDIHRRSKLALKYCKRNRRKITNYRDFCIYTIRRWNERRVK